VSKPAAGAQGHLLLLLRHSKAERDAGRDDHERKLAPRGRRDAKRIAAVIEARAFRPERILCSSSRRTRETLAPILPRLEAGIDVVIDRDLYLAPPERILERIAGVDDRVRTLLVVGHNPGMADLAAILARGGEGDALARMRRKFPTSGLAAIQSDAACWRDLRLRGGILVAFVVPREPGAG
jgi:phosphohistidine phosphatase